MIELLAPAKDLEKAKIAIDMGADAVYLGGKKYSLRARASNFGHREMEDIVLYAHERAKKVYVTVNMVFHDSDLVGIKEYIRELSDLGVDAVIVESVGLLTMVKKIAPHLEVHISTQASALNSKVVETYALWGADRVVLARECSMRDIETIAKRTKMPLEVFIHGGMCANYSGHCTLSDHYCLRDANRGGCAHSCRWRYDLYADGELLSDPERPFSMAAKDLRATAYIERMIKADIASLKIEGRMKSAYYIAQITRTYRKLIDEVYREGRLTAERIAYYDKEILKAENRHSACGFLDGKLTSERQIYTKEATMVTHDFVGIVKAYDKATGMAKVEVRNRFAVGDKLEVFGKDIDNKSLLVTSLYDEEGMALAIANKPMSLITVPVPFVVQEGDMIRKAT